MTSFSIISQEGRILLAATLISLAAAAAAQGERHPDPSWRDSALAFLPQGYVAGEAYRTDSTTGYLAVYPAGADDAKWPASVFAPRHVLVVKLADGKAVSAELRPRDDRRRGNRDTTMTDPGGSETEFDRLHGALCSNQ